MEEKTNDKDWQQELARLYVEELRENIRRREQRKQDRKDFDQKLEQMGYFVILILAFIAGLLFIIAAFPV